MLLNDFYKLKEQTESNGDWSFKVELNPNHAIYTGHFPNQPIVPGVCNLQIIRECSELVLKQKVRIVNISSCKYLTVVDPTKNKDLDIQLSLKASEAGEYMLQALGAFEETDFIKLKATIKVV